MITKEEAKEELKSYYKLELEIENLMNDIEKNKNMKEGLQAVKIDGLPKSTVKDDKLEEAIERLDEDKKKLNDEFAEKYKMKEYINSKIKQIKYPEGTVLDYKYKQKMRDWEIAEKFKVGKKQARRYLENALILYRNL